MTTTHFGMIGAGWRAEFFLRVAEALPGHFRVKRMLVRNPEKAKQISDRWKVQTVQTLDALLKPNDLDFVVVSVPWAVTPIMLRELTERRMPALAETPPAPDLDGLIAINELTKIGGKIQVAEQYQFQPAHAARLAVARSGKIGIVSQAQVSAAHGYHGINLIRGLLNVNYEDVTIRAQSFESPVIAGPTRNGPPLYEQVKPVQQTIAYLDYGDRLGVYDFAWNQYYSWIRTKRVLVRGERGEIDNMTVRYLIDYQTPIETELRRLNAGEDGNLEGYYFKGILLGDEWVVRNPFAPARISDDELAIAICLQKMAEYVHGGPDFCSLAQASQDHYLSLMINRAVESGEAVRCTRQSWSE